jgi:hypothetical protein
MLDFFICLTLMVFAYLPSTPQCSVVANCMSAVSKSQKTSG